MTLLGGAAIAGVSRTGSSGTQQPGKVPRVGILTPAENTATPRRLLWVVACNLENAEIIVELNIE
jgi:hypothetical protein